MPDPNTGSGRQANGQGVQTSKEASCAGLQAPLHWHGSVNCNRQIIPNAAAGLGLSLVCQTCLVVVDLEAVAERLQTSRTYGSKGE